VRLLHKRLQRALHHDNVNQDLLTLLLGDVPDSATWVRYGARIAAAIVLGAVIGLQRELGNKPAGLRTHILVTLAATVFVLVPLEAGVRVEDVSRVIQGVATGIGFIGAGAILKVWESREIHGLTTAATVWVATAIGIAVGLGQIILAVAATLAAWLVLSALMRFEAWLDREARGDDESRRESRRAPRRGSTPNQSNDH
jgi:putative Mg2+ transporter-C (MgtC) family protein